MLTWCFLNCQNGVIAEDNIGEVVEEIVGPVIRSIEGNLYVIGSTVFRFHSASSKTCIELTIEREGRGIGWFGGDSFVTCLWGGRWLSGFASFGNLYRGHVHRGNLCCCGLIVAVGKNQCVVEVPVATDDRRVRTEVWPRINKVPDEDKRISHAQLHNRTTLGRNLWIKQYNKMHLYSVFPSFQLQDIDGIWCLCVKNLFIVQCLYTLHSDCSLSGDSNSYSTRCRSTALSIDLFGYFAPCVEREDLQP